MPAGLSGTPPRSGKDQALTIEEVDRRVAPQFPMVGIDCPEDLKFTADDWVGVVDYAIQLVGEDHVAFGSDFDGGPTLPRGMRDIRDLAMITDAMLRRGYSEERIRKVPWRQLATSLPPDHGKEQHLAVGYVANEGAGTAGVELT